MGAFYGSVQIKADDRERILAAAEEIAERLAIRCLVGPVISGWVGVYPSTNGQDENVGAALAERLGGTVWHILVHDDDFLTYWLWYDGKIADSFHSLPGYFGPADRDQEEQMTGNAKVLASLLGGDIAVLRDLLDRGNQDLSASDRLDALGRAVGVKNLATAYEYLKDGETEGIAGWRKFKELPASALSQKKREAAERRHALQALKKSGLLLLHEPMKGRESGRSNIPRACSAAGGLLVFRSGLGALASVSATRYAAPKFKPEHLPWATTGQANGVVADAMGRRAALALGKCVEVWDTVSGARIAEIAETDWAIKVALNANGTRLAKTSRQELAVFDVDTGRQLLSMPADKTGYQVALDPSGEWIVRADQRIEFAQLSGPGEWRWLTLAESTVPAGQEAMRGRKFAEPDVDMLVQNARAAWELQFASHGDREELATKIEEGATKLRAQLEGLRRANMLWQNQSTTCLGFTRDGAWLWVGTSNALWVFQWSDVMSRDERAQATWWYPTTRFKPVMETQEHVCSVAEEHREAAIVFATVKGRLYRMQLETGEVRELMQWPEEMPIELHLTDDDRALGCVCRTICRGVDMEKSDRPSWQIWDYGRVRAEAPPS